MFRFWSAILKYVRPVKVFRFDSINDVIACNLRFSDNAVWAFPNIVANSEKLNLNAFFNFELQYLENGKT